jgi:hypothetical protein
MHSGVKMQNLLRRDKNQRRRRRTNKERTEAQPEV